jgi:predicted nuclease with TOPRIM domain
MNLKTPEELQGKIQELSARHARVLKRKAELSGELKSKRDELVALVKEIQEAGYNPKTLLEERNKVQVELESMIDEFEKNLVESETILSTFDRK